MRPCETCHGRGTVLANIWTKLWNYIDIITCPVCNGNGSHK